MSTHNRDIENLEAVRRLDQVRERVTENGGQADVSDSFEIEVDGIKHDAVIRLCPASAHRFEHPALSEKPAPWGIRS